MARSADHTRVIVACNDSTGEIAVFDSNGNLLTGPKALGSGAVSFAAANSDGSQFAVVFGAPGASRFFFAGWKSELAGFLLFAKRRGDYFLP